MTWINTVKEVQISVKEIFNACNMMKVLYNKTHQEARLNSEKLC